MQPFHLEFIPAGGDCAVLRIDGEIDASAAPRLRERVTGLAGNGTVHLIADLRGAGFAGLGRRGCAGGRPEGASRPRGIARAGGQHRPDPAGPADQRAQ